MILWSNQSLYCLWIKAIIFWPKPKSNTNITFKNFNLVYAANDKGLIQCWDVALTPIYLQLSGEFNTGYILDIGHNINRLPIGLCDMKWCDRNRLQPSFMESMAFNYFLLRFNNGPLALLRFSGGVLEASGSLGMVSSKILIVKSIVKAKTLLTNLIFYKKKNHQSLILVPVQNQFANFEESVAKKYYY